MSIAATTDPACLDDADLIFVATPVVANQANFLMIHDRQNNRKKTRTKSEISHNCFVRKELASR